MEESLSSGPDRRSIDYILRLLHELPWDCFGRSRINKEFKTLHLNGVNWRIFWLSPKLKKQLIDSDQRNKAEEKRVCVQGWGFGFLQGRVGGGARGALYFLIMNFAADGWVFSEQIALVSYLVSSFLHNGGQLKDSDNSQCSKKKKKNAAYLDLYSLICNREMWNFGESH